MHSRAWENSYSRHTNMNWKKKQGEKLMDALRALV